MMNERIKELAEQAKDYAAYYSMLSDFSEYGIFTEKFAELIIQGCVTQIALIGVSNFENDDVGWTVDKSIENIRKHFGVES